MIIAMCPEHAVLDRVYTIEEIRQQIDIYKCKCIIVDDED